MKVEVTFDGIKRPVPEVFSFVADISTHTQWDPTCVEAAYTSPGPLRVGSTYRRTDKFMGRRIKGTGEVTAYEANRKIAWSVPPPTRGEAAYIFEASEGGATKIRAQYEVKLSGFFWVVAPLVPFMARRAAKAGFRNLKRVLEAKR